MSCLRNIDRYLSLQKLCLKLDAREFVNDIAQLRRVVDDRSNDAGKNYCEVNLRRFCRKVLSAADFVRYGNHLEGSLPSDLDPHHWSPRISLIQGDHRGGIPAWVLRSCHTEQKW